MLFRTFAQQIAEPQSKITSNIQNMFMEFLVFFKSIATQPRQRHGQYSGNQRLDGTQPEPLLAGKRGPWIKEGYLPSFANKDHLGVLRSQSRLGVHSFDRL